MKIINKNDAIARLKSLERPWAANYLAMYSSWLGGITTDAWLMSVPLDDHLVHRGDGVFEAAKCEAGRIFQWEPHLERLHRSAAAIGLTLPHDRKQFTELVTSTCRAAGEPDLLLRLFVSRGPGGFSTDPRECPQPGVYIVAARLHHHTPQAIAQGVQVGLSRGVPIKNSFYAGVKSCNYLPNVLLKMEALRQGWDFALGLDEQGFVAEGSTENFALVDHQGRLLFPSARNILEGTTALRVQELASALLADGTITGLEHRDLTPEDLAAARELMLMGTTLDVMPVTRLEGKPVGDGRSGPVALELHVLLRKDILGNPAVSTPID